MKRHTHAAEHRTKTERRDHAGNPVVKFYEVCHCGATRFYRKGQTLPKWHACILCVVLPKDMPGRPA